MLENTGLVLEGGGMRGVYTGRILEYFMEQDLYFPYVIGVSAGACHAASYLSRQRNRNKTVNIDYASHPKYLSYKTYGENVSYLIWILFFMKFQKSMCRLILKHTLIAPSVFL